MSLVLHQINCKKKNKEKTYRLKEFLKKNFNGKKPHYSVQEYAFMKKLFFKTDRSNYYKSE